MIAEIALEAGRFVLMCPEDLSSRYGVDPPALPFAASFTVAVRDIMAVRALLERNNIGVARHGNGLSVSNADAHGATINFDQA